MASGVKVVIAPSTLRGRRVRIVPTVRNATSAAVAVRIVAIVHRAVTAPTVPIAIPSCVRNTSRAARAAVVAGVTVSPIRTRRSPSSRR